MDIAGTFHSMSTQEKTLIIGGGVAVVYLLYSAYFKSAATSTTATTTVDTQAADAQNAAQTQAANFTSTLQAALDAQSTTFNAALNAATANEQSDVAGINSAIATQNTGTNAALQAISDQLTKVLTPTPTGVYTTPVTTTSTSTNTNYPGLPTTWSSMSTSDKASWIMTNGDYNLSGAEYQTLINTNPGLSSAVDTMNQASSANLPKPVVVAPSINDLNNTGTTSTTVVTTPTPVVVASPTVAQIGQTLGPGMTSATGYWNSKTGLVVAGPVYGWDATNGYTENGVPVASATSH